MTEKSHKKILGIITARGGSKGIPGKNIKKLAGKPLIAYTIEAAQKSGVFDRIILSTDDEKIARVARTYGCEIPFMRPKRLAKDKTPHFPVIVHAMDWLEKHEHYIPDYVMILQPTAPLRTAAHIREAVSLFEMRGADSVVSVSEIPRHFHPRWLFNVNTRKHMAIFTGEKFSQLVSRRQDLSKTYTRNGAIYLFKTVFCNSKHTNFYGNHVIAFVMKPNVSVNIDTMEDWREAEALLADARASSAFKITDKI